jgi:hypothetical protein
VSDKTDNCPTTANPNQGDADEDGVGDACDNCTIIANADQANADEDALGDACDTCPNDPENDADQDGVCGDVDQCPDTPRQDVGSVDATGCVTGGGGGTAVCGNGTLETGEGCDDGNTTAGDGCDENCQVEGGPANDDCADAIAITDGQTDFSNVDATTDGAEEPTACNFFGNANIHSDVWFCYTATCTGEVVASLCGSQYDTKMAVYAGCECATDEPLACSDDDCGGGAFDSRVVFQASAGESYLVRIGGFFEPSQGAAEGSGTLTIRCGEDVCGSGQGDCFAAHDTPGCEDADCCSTTCDVDAYCCDVEWDDFCSQEAAGLCSETGFATCGEGAGDCLLATGNGSPGCENADCCNTVCEMDPFCCIDNWDDICAGEAADNCFLLDTCGPDAGSCYSANSTPGCNQVSCCETVCATDPYCCNTEWDATCGELATTECR